MKLEMSTSKYPSTGLPSVKGPKHELIGSLEQEPEIIEFDDIDP